MPTDSASIVSSNRFRHTAGVLADDLALIDIDSRHVRGWLELLLPPGLLVAPTWALLVWNGTELVHAVVSGRGSVEPTSIPFRGPTRRSLADARTTLGVDAVIAIRPETFSEIAAEAENAVKLGDHYTAQSLHWLTAVRKQNRKGVWLDPPLLDLVPPISVEGLERAFDLFVPDDSAMAAYIVSDDRKRIEASVIAVKRNGRIQTVSTHAHLADALDERSLARTWTSDYRRALDGIGQKFAPPSVALFIERAAVRRILGGPADQLSRELRNKTAIIDPMPRWLAGLLGGAAAVAVAQRSAKRLSGLLPTRARKAAASVASTAARRAKESGAHPWQVLGFDPIELFRKLQRYYRDE